MSQRWHKTTLKLDEQQKQQPKRKTRKKPAVKRVGKRVRAEKDDVTGGRGKMSGSRPGNEAFTELIKKYASLHEKGGGTLGTKEIQKRVREELPKNCRFLINYDPEDRTGLLLSEKESLIKIGRAIRYRINAKPGDSEPGAGSGTEIAERATGSSNHTASLSEATATNDARDPAVNAIAAPNPDDFTSTWVWRNDSKQQPIKEASSAISSTGCPAANLSLLYAAKAGAFTGKALIQKPANTHLSRIPSQSIFMQSDFRLPVPPGNHGQEKPGTVVEQRIQEASLSQSQVRQLNDNEAPTSDPTDSNQQDTEPLDYRKSWTVEPFFQVQSSSSQQTQPQRNFSCDEDADDFI